MEYDFNEIRSMLDQGVKVEDLCNAFAKEVNRVTAEIEEENKSKRHYQTVLNDLVAEWNSLIDMVGEDYYLTEAQKQALQVTPVIVDILIGMVMGKMVIDETVSQLTKPKSGPTQLCQDDQKIVAKPITASTFEQTIADFLNDR